MKLDNDVLRYDERAIIDLRSLYRQFGYMPYRMSRFEEYGLYADNKAFLTSGEIIAFTGANGKLMAMRPDVTLSIVKNMKDDAALKKLYYNENVYRPDGHEFKEHMQVGLECIGAIDVYLMGETLVLASCSLEILGGRSCLDVSHMGYINGLMMTEDLTPEQRAELLKRVSSRNMHELDALCREYALSGTFRERIVALTELYGPYGRILPELRRISVNYETENALGELEGILGVLKQFGAEDKINLDFSLVNDLGYYSGIIFHGYVEGIPVRLLSGGRYDTLLRKFGKRSGAVGFAVYLDLLERFRPPVPENKADVLILYNDCTDAEKLAETVSGLIAGGLRVNAQREDPGNIEYERLIKL